MGQRLSGDRSELAARLERGRLVLCLPGGRAPNYLHHERHRGFELKTQAGCQGQGTHFPSDDAATKLLYLILNRSEKEWKMPRREWSMAKAQFAVIFGERFIKAMAA